MMRRRLVPGVALAVGLMVGGVATAACPEPPASSTVVSVSGSHRDGYRVEFLDGARLHTPTWSETLAECSEYRTRLNRVRCRVSERTSFRHYALLRNSLRYAQQHTGGQ